MSLSPLVLALPRRLRSRDRTSTECCGQEDVRPCAPPPVDHHRLSTHPIPANEAMKERRHRRTRTLHCLHGLVHRLVNVPTYAEDPIFSLPVSCARAASADITSRNVNVSCTRGWHELFQAYTITSALVYLYRSIIRPV